MLLRIPNLQLNPRILPESVRVRIRESFAAISDGFGSSSDATVISRYRLIDMDLVWRTARWPVVALRLCGVPARNYGLRHASSPHLRAHQWTCSVAGVKFIMPLSGIRNRVRVRGFFLRIRPKPSAYEILRTVTTLFVNIAVLALLVSTNSISDTFWVLMQVSATLFVCSINTGIAILFHLFFGNIRIWYQYFCPQVN